MAGVFGSSRRGQSTDNASRSLKRAVMQVGKSEASHAKVMELLELAEQKKQILARKKGAAEQTLQREKELVQLLREQATNERRKRQLAEQVVREKQAERGQALLATQKAQEEAQDMEGLQARCEEKQQRAAELERHLAGMAQAYHKMVQETRSCIAERWQIVREIRELELFNERLHGSLAAWKDEQEMQQQARKTEQRRFCQTYIEALDAKVAARKDAPPPADVVALPRDLVVS
mmetsp:Transcript_31861/g.77692  ORF Transcript_31861/g.77692 Transcript_31861/m.77692 type:complete len:234 (+) Transcript_31861:42-743(+)